MSRSNKLLKDTFIYSIANFGSKLLTFIMLPIYTHFFTTAEYGTWDLVLTTIYLLIPFITFELVSAVYRWLIIEKNDEMKKNIITTGVFTILRNLLIFNLIGMLFIYFVSIPYSWIALVLINTEIFSSFVQQSARGLGYNKLFASLGIIQTVVTLSLNLFFMFILELRVESFFYSSIIAGLVVVGYAWWSMNLGKYINLTNYSKSLFKDFLHYSIPIVPGAVSWWVMNMSDRYFITIFLGMESNGVYAVSNKIPSLILMVSTVFFLAWKDSAIREYSAEDKNQYYSKMFRYFFRLMTTSVICLVLLTKPIIELVVSNNFSDAWKYIGFLLLATLFNGFSQFWGAGYHGAKKTNIIFVTSFAGATVNVIVNFLLIEYLGLYAVALSTFLAFLTMWLIRALSINHYFKITINYKDMIILFPIISLSLVVPFIFTGISYLIAVLISFIIFIVFNWEIIKFLKQAFIKAFNKMRSNN